MTKRRTIMNNIHIDPESVKDRWDSKGDGYYRELEAFNKKHERSDEIVYSSEGVPLYAKYIFPPTQALVEHDALMFELGRACKEERQ